DVTREIGAAASYDACPHFERQGAGGTLDQVCVRGSTAPHTAVTGRPIARPGCNAGASVHRSIEELLADAAESGRSLPEVVLAREASETGRDRTDIRARVQRNLKVMRAAVTEGLMGEARSASGLTGGRAKRLFENGP